MIQVKNNQTGDIETLESDKDLPLLVEQGAVSIPDQEYEFESPEGDKYKIPAQGFLDAVKMGWRYRDGDTIKEEKLSQQYGDQTAKALLYGVARGATLGLSDLALKPLVGEEELSNVKKYNETASLVGEVGATIAPAFLSGGTSLLAKGAQKTVAGAATALAETIGKRAAQNITSDVAKRAINMGAAGAVEGALVGAGQTVSEAALGDHEFNAETLLQNVGTGALLGGAIGGLTGAGVEYAKKAIKGGTTQIKKTFIQASDIPAEEKKVLLKEIQSAEDLQSITKTVFDDATLKEVAARNNWPTTPGMETRFKPFQTLEKSIAEGASAPGSLIAQNIEEVQDVAQKEITKLVGTGEDISPLMAGDNIKKTVISDVDARIQPAKEFLNRVSEDFGNAEVSPVIMKRLDTRLSESQSFRIGKGSAAVKEIVEMIPQIKTLNDLEYARKTVGKMIRRADPKDAQAIQDAYNTLKRAQRDAIGKLALQAGPKRGPKLAKEVLRGYDEAFKTYQNVYKDYEIISQQLGIKIGSPDTFLDDLAEEASEKIGQKIIDTKDYRQMEMLYKKHPGIFEEARKVQLMKIAKTSMNAEGDFMVDTFVRKVRRMTGEERKVLFGFDNHTQKRIDDFLVYTSKLPKKLNTSGTAISQFFQSMLSPVYQGTEYARYLLYKGGEKALKSHFLDNVPVYGAIEQSSNRAKNKISSSVGGFFKASGFGVSAALLKTYSDKDIEKAKKSYEQVQSDPEGMINKFIENNKELSKAAPETANALQQRLIAGVQFLKSKTPHRDQEYLGEKIEPSRAELMKFSDYVEAVENPRIVFDQLKDGYMNPVTLETLRVVYPKTYASIQAEMIAKLPKQLTRQQKIQLQPILGSKVTPAMDYQNLMRLQGKTQESSQAQQLADQQVRHVPTAAARNIKLADRSKTGLDKRLNRA